MFVLCFIGVLCAMAVPSILSGLDRSRARAAARYISHQCGLARIQAIGRSAVVALRFVPRGDEYEVQMFIDRNRNGVRTADIAAGVDTPLGPPESLSTNFRGVRIGLAPELGLGTDAVKLGSGGLLSFTPLGTATAGSIYIVGKDGSQFALRVIGATARTRLQWYDRHARAWVSY